MNSKLFIAMLAAKYAQIQVRLKSAIEPLDEISLNWRPNENSSSIANLILYLAGTIQYRIENDFHGEPEPGAWTGFNPMQWKSKEELLEIIEDSFQRLDEAVRRLGERDFLTEAAGTEEAINPEVLHQCASHFSEHLGQVLYLSQMRTPAVTMELQHG
ncbi:DinB family protein [Paenibacillus aurantius]|uniref:DinB family protein n=1 Tax=Paenibacillus aurantius TaxID=2918900 RepID=A0AA96LDY8_9BACL|nr:DinB family protein [Paenibacillus aurantius]WJH35080.1 DinB family protein [Paenibacillus sp. CC-CFT747]WNQ10336.1 DinB family protein [Paenibacillus aurantius]